jgi:hypothetical protein
MWNTVSPTLTNNTFTGNTDLRSRAVFPIERRGKIDGQRRHRQWVKRDTHRSGVHQRRPKAVPVSGDGLRGEICHGAERQNLDDRARRGHQIPRTAAVQYIRATAPSWHRVLSKHRSTSPALRMTASAATLMVLLPLPLPANWRYHDRLRDGCICNSWSGAC